MKQYYSGEGDYQASRRVNTRQTGFVKFGGSASKTAGSTASLMWAAEQSGQWYSKRSDKDGSVSSEVAMPITRSLR
jgi:hypothetical protein